jgi:hypothetical protein
MSDSKVTRLRPRAAPPPPPARELPRLEDIEPFSLRDHFTPEQLAELWRPVFLQACRKAARRYLDAQNAAKSADQAPSTAQVD